MTRQRQVILDEIRKVRTHPTADEVYAMTRKQLPRISLGTIYRNLEILSACGLIQKMKLATKQKRFDGNAANHYHVRCISCGRVEDVHIKPIEAFEKDLGELSDYRIIGHRLEFIGVCPQCKADEVGSQKT